MHIHCTFLSGSCGMHAGLGRHLAHLAGMPGAAKPDVLSCLYVSAPSAGEGLD